MKAARLMLSTLLAMLLSTPAYAQPPADCNPADPAQVRLRIRIDNIHSAKGSINITIYPDDARHFLDGKYKLLRQRAPVVLPVTEVCIAMPAAANYAIALYQDLNDNGHFDTTFIGLPDEPYGFSNNPRLVLGPPGLEDVRFAAQPGDNQIAIRLRH